MASNTKPRWENLRDADSQQVESLLRNFFDDVAAYRYNSASIRVRVIDKRFSNMTAEQRDELVEQKLLLLSEELQRDIVSLLTFAPDELQNSDASFRQWLLNAEFESPSPSIL